MTPVVKRLTLSPLPQAFIIFQLSALAIVPPDQDGPSGLKKQIERKGLGWVEGFEPSTAGATVRSSTTELHPPQYEKL